jgi:hypothetical protein
MSIEPKTQRLEHVEAGLRSSPSSDLDDIRHRLLRAIKHNSSEAVLQRLIELAARCVSEAAAWDAFADAQEVDATHAWSEIQRLEREAHAAKQARIRIVDRLRAEIGE